MGAIAQDAVMQRITATIALQQQGEHDEARSRFASMWTGIGPQGDPLHLCVLAHYMADLQEDPAQELWWDLQALEAADQLSDHGVQQLHASLSIGAFYPSLHLNLAEDYREAGDPQKARTHLEQAERSLDALPNDEYARMIRRGIARLVISLSLG